MSDLIKVSSELKLYEASEVDLSDISESQVIAIKSKIDISDTNSIINFGIESQKEISEFTDSILQSSSASDLGDFGESLGDLVLKMKGVDVDKVKSNSFFQSLPIIGDLISYSFDKFSVKFESVLDQVEKITSDLQKEMFLISSSIETLDECYNHNIQLIKSLDTYIKVAEDKMRELVSGELELLRLKAEKSKDILDVEAYKDLESQAVRLGSRIHNMIYTRHVATESAPTIRQLQRNFIQLSQDFTDVIVNVVPMWKRQFMLAIEINKQGKMAKISNEIKNFSNSQHLNFKEKMLSLEVEVTEALSRGVVDTDTLKKATELTCEAILVHQNRVSQTLMNQKEMSEAIKLSQDKLKETLMEANR